METSRLNRALASWRDWPLDLKQQPIATRQLSGFTNQGFVLDAGNQQLVLRLNRIDADSLGIDRHQEYLIWRVLADLGIAPQLIQTNMQQDFVLYEYVPGRTWTAGDLQRSAQIKRLNQMIQTWQHICIDVTERNYIDYLQHYWKQLVGTPAATTELTAEWQHFLPELEAFQQSDWTPVLSHHDLIPENIIDDGQRLYIIDWEYAALGHPELDWCSIDGNKNHPARRVLDWINRLWWLLPNTPERFNTDN